MIIVAVKLFSILMNLDKIVLQVAVNILTKLSIQYPVHLFIILVIISINLKQKHLQLEIKMTMKL